MANRRFNTQTTQPLKSGGRAKMMGGGMSTARRDMRSGYYPSDMGMAGGAMYKKGGKVGKKKQGYAAREDESLGMRRGKASTKKQGMKARRDESKGMAKKVGKKRAYGAVKTMDKKR